MVRLPAQTQLHHHHGGGKNSGQYLAFNCVYDLSELSFKVLLTPHYCLFCFIGPGVVHSGESMGSIEYR